VSFLVRKPLPREKWHKCPVCEGTGLTEMERDMHRSGGVVPCPSFTCERGIVKSELVKKKR
jgi:hypothetical protein